VFLVIEQTFFGPLLLCQIVVLPSVSTLWCIIRRLLASGGGYTAGSLPMGLCPLTPLQYRGCEYSLQYSWLWLDVKTWLLNAAMRVLCTHRLSVTDAVNLEQRT